MKKSIVVALELGFIIAFSILFFTGVGPTLRTPQSTPPGLRHQAAWPIRPR